MFKDEKQLLETIPNVFACGKGVEVGPGDDCAVLDFGLDAYRLVAVDQVVSDIHYMKGNTSPSEIAVKLLRRNISDIAAMGGTPSQALIAMTLSSETWLSDDWIDKFLAALADEAAAWDISVCGGDVSSTKSDADVFSLTIMGWVERRLLALRSAGKPGDRIYVTGEFGGSFESGRHLTFRPRLEEARFLVEGGFANAMIDVSDGLMLDAARIAEMSGLEFSIDETTVPIAEGASLSQALSEGEDYELLFSVPPDKVADLESAWPFENLRLTRIGELVARKSDSLPKMRLSKKTGGSVKGFSHFSACGTGGAGAE